MSAFSVQDERSDNDDDVYYYTILFNTISSFVKRTFNMFQQLQECVLNATDFFGKLFVVV